MLPSAAADVPPLRAAAAQTLAASQRSDATPQRVFPGAADRVVKARLGCHAPPADVNDPVVAEGEAPASRDRTQ